MAQLDELLRAKGVMPKGVKAEKAMEVVWRYTKEEITTWRAKQEERPSQLTLDSFADAK